MNTNKHRWFVDRAKHCVYEILIGLVNARLQYTAIFVRRKGFYAAVRHEFLGIPHGWKKHGYFL
jgi:hypothetical protein